MRRGIMFAAVALLLVGAPHAAETSEKPVARNSTLVVSGAGIPTQHVDMASLGDEEAATTSEPGRQHERFSSIRGDAMSRGGDSLNHRLKTGVVLDDDLAGGGGDRRRLQDCSQTNVPSTAEGCNARSNCHIEGSYCSCSCVEFEPSGGGGGASPEVDVPVGLIVGLIAGGLSALAALLRCLPVVVLVGGGLVAGVLYLIISILDALAEGAAWLSRGCKPRPQATATLLSQDSAASGSHYKFTRLESALVACNGDTRIIKPGWNFGVMRTYQAVCEPAMSVGQHEIEFSIESRSGAVKVGVCSGARLSETKPKWDEGAGFLIELGERGSLDKGPDSSKAPGGDNYGKEEDQQGGKVFNEVEVDDGFKKKLSTMRFAVGDTIRMRIDFDSGTLAVLADGSTHVAIKSGLRGPLCWVVALQSRSDCLQIQADTDSTVELGLAGGVSPVINPVSANVNVQTPQMSPRNDSASHQVDTQPKSLSATLTDANLAQYEEALHELGCTTTEHLCDLEEEDMVGIGMKKMGEWPSNNAAVAAAAVAAAAPADAAVATTADADDVSADADVVATQNAGA